MLSKMNELQAFIVIAYVLKLGRTIVCFEREEDEEVMFIFALIMQESMLLRFQIVLGLTNLLF